MPVGPTDPLRDQLKDQFVIQSYAVEKEDNLLFSSLIQIFESSDKAVDFEERSGGSGLTLLKLIRDWGKTAQPKDRALVTEERNAVVDAGVQGELTLDSFNAYFRRFRRAERFVPPIARHSDETVMQQLNNLMFRDPTTREFWEITQVVSASKMVNLEGLVGVIREMLRSRKVSLAIDEVVTGRRPIQSSFASTNVDPKKGLKGSGSRSSADGKKFPEARDDSGKVVRWVTGMVACNCGGFHLFKDCPNPVNSNSTRRAKSVGKKVSGSTTESSNSTQSKHTTAVSSQGGLVLSDDGGVDLSDDAVAAELLAFFDSEISSDASVHYSEALVSASAGNRGSARSSRDDPPRRSSQTRVGVFNREYRPFEKLAFYSVNVGPSPGVYYGSWADVSGLVSGFSAPPGVTTHRKFLNERDAVDHARANGVDLQGYQISQSDPNRSQINPVEEKGSIQSASSFPAIASPIVAPRTPAPSLRAAPSPSVAVDAGSERFAPQMAEEFAARNASDAATDALLSDHERSASVILNSGASAHERTATDSSVHRPPTSANDAALKRTAQEFCLS